VLITGYGVTSPILFKNFQSLRQNPHLSQEYLAVLETNHHTPYFLNLHHRDVAHTMILGRTGAGKSFLLNFLINEPPKIRSVDLHF
jgi:type IV secretory pathway VirB4 component